MGVSPGGWVLVNSFNTYLKRYMSPNLIQRPSESEPKTCVKAWMVREGGDT